MHVFKLSALILSFFCLASGASAVDLDGYKDLGKPATEAQVTGWNITVFPDGTGLPEGKGTIAAGAKIYQTQCMACHGVNLEGALGPRLVGGKGTLATHKPIKTIGSYWPYATTLFDYIRRAMPFQSPQSLSNDEVYSVTAYLLNKNDILADNETLDAKSLAAIKMPNRDNFYIDDRPDTKNPRCMHDCLKK